MEDLKNLCLCEWIVPFVRNLSEGKTGFCVGGIKIENPISSSAPGSTDTLQNDIFTIAVPFGGEVIRWQFIFDGTNKKISPDILLPSTGFDDFDPEFDDIKSLLHWDNENKDSLLLAVQETVHLFKEHQRQVCYGIDKNLSSELSELLSDDDYASAEVYLKRAPKTKAPKSLNVLVKLPVDLKPLLEMFSKEISERDSIIHSPLLLVKFDLEIKKAVPMPFLPSHLEKIIGSKEQLNIPPYTMSTTIHQYVKKVEEKLAEVVQTVVTSHSKRCEYVAAFLRQFPADVLEYDAQNFSSISLVFSYQTFYFLVHISLSKFFPQNLPSVTIQSAYHLTKQDELFKKTFTNYPYSPRWSGTEMAKRTKNFILEKIPLFKDSCIRNGVLC
ncbi:BRISC and BRCA1-A complex member 2 [Ciona intestinalis]